LIERLAVHGARHPADPLHHIVVVGGGAAGLELVTGLGDRLGRQKLASITLVDCAYVPTDQASAARPAIIAVHLPRLRLAGFPRQMDDGRKSDGLSGRPRLLRAWRHPACPSGDDQSCALAHHAGPRVKLH
jgi:hypothetical protein